MHLYTLLFICGRSVEESSADNQTVEVSSEPMSLPTPLKEQKDKFYLSSSLTDGVLQQVEVSITTRVFLNNLK